jgi:DNA-3-methyladenine glycosylase I
MAAYHDEGYRRVFKGLKIDVCAQMTDEELAAALLDEGIIRHKGKVASVKANALAVQQIQKEHGSFSRFCWSFVNFEPILTRAKALEDLEVTTPSSVSMSKALKKAGLKFCGPTICQSFLQAGGMLNDHVEGCPQRDACRKDWLAADPGF